MYSKRWIGVVAVAVIVGLALPLAASEQVERTCLKCKVKGLVGAMRAGDVERSLSYLAGDFELRDVAGDKRVDREAMRGLLQWDAALGGKMAFSELQWEGDTVRGEFSETNEMYDLLGMGPQRYRIEFRFDGDLIREQVYEALDADGPSLDEALEPFLTWASEDHASDLKRIYPEGRFAFGSASAERWIELLQVWKASTEVASVSTAPAP